MTVCTLPPDVLRQIADARQRARAPYDEALNLIASIRAEPAMVCRQATPRTVTTAELREHWPTDDENLTGH